MHRAVQVHATALWGRPMLLLLLVPLLLLRLLPRQWVALQEFDLEPAQQQHHTPQHEVLPPCAQRQPDTTSNCMSPSCGHGCSAAWESMPAFQNQKLTLEYLTNKHM